MVSQMLSNLAINVVSVSKSFLLFNNPIERLKQILGVKNKMPEYKALKDINIQINKGDTVGIIGVNGSGKSTLLQIICGTLSPTQGNVELNGRVSALLELGAGFNPEFTGVENVKLNAALMGLTKSEIDGIFDDVIKFADIGDFLYQPVKTYSSGMFARLAFSTAIHVKPEILIVDEILAVGDARFQRKCLDKLREIREAGCTILFVSHDDYQIRNICNKVLYLKKGEQIFFGEANQGVNMYLQDLQSLDAKDEIISKNEDDQNVSMKLIEIVNTKLMNKSGELVSEIQSGENVFLEFEYLCNDIRVLDNIHFVFNLYRIDDVYVCGTTTQMQNKGPYKIRKNGKVRIEFPNLRLLSGIYHWRVAINDGDGIQIISEALPVCRFSVSDSFSAVGVYDINHQWSVEGY